jgi:PmbA protein
MKSLIDCAGSVGAEFEIYSRSSETKSVSIENSELKDVKSCMSSGVGLRLIKNGMSGLSFTRNLTDPESLVKNAMASLRAGVEAKFTFPCTKEYLKLRTNSVKSGQITSDELLAESFRMRDLLARKAKAQVNAGARLFTAEYRLINSAGTDISWKESSVEKYGSLISAGGSEYSAGDSGFDLLPMSDASLLNVVRLFEADRAEIRPEPGKQKVLFMPRAMNTLLWRVQSGANGQSLHQKITPLAGRIGEKVFSDILTLRNNPLNDSIPGARSVDDEGVPCSNFPLIDRGVFKGFYCDLNFAAKTGSVPTGHGFRRSMWGGDPVILKPQPYLGHLFFDKGEKSFDALLKEMGKGIVVFSALGDHTGNIPNGDFSVGLSLGLCVENGRIVGKAKDTMVSGNIYDIMKRAVAVGSESEPAYSNNPPVLFDGVDVSS